MSSSRPCPLYEADRYDVSESVGHQLMSLIVVMRRELEVRMAAHGLTEAQWKPLWVLKEGMATTAFELAREMSIDAGAVTRAVDRLEAKQLVERVRSASDRRVVHLRLTDAGQQAVAKVPHVLASMNNDFLRGFTEGEWHELRRLIGRMAANGRALTAERAAA